MNERKPGPMTSEEFDQVFGPGNLFDKIKTGKDLNEFFAKMNSFGYKIKEIKPKKKNAKRN